MDRRRGDTDRYGRDLAGSGGRGREGGYQYYDKGSGSRGEGYSRAESFDRDEYGSSQGRYRQTEAFDRSDYGVSRRANQQSEGSYGGSWGRYQQTEALDRSDYGGSRERYQQTEDFDRFDRGEYGGSRGAYQQSKGGNYGRYEQTEVFDRGEIGGSRGAYQQIGGNYGGSRGRNELSEGFDRRDYGGRRGAYQESEGGNYGGSKGRYEQIEGSDRGNVGGGSRGAYHQSEGGNYGGSKGRYDRIEASDRGNFGGSRGAYHQSKGGDYGGSRGVYQPSEGGYGGGRRYDTHSEQTRGMRSGQTPAYQSPEKRRSPRSESRPSVAARSRSPQQSVQSQSSPPDIHSVPVSVTEFQPRPFIESSKEINLPIKRPDSGGKSFVRQTNLLVNHFPVQFNPQTIIFHYDVDIKAETIKGDMPKRSKLSKSIPKSDLLLIREELFTKDPTRFPMGMTAYDGEKNIFSAIALPTGDFKVNLSDGEDSQGRKYIFSIKLVNQLKLGKLKEYLKGEILQIPRDILQGMDLVMKENPSRNRICLGQNTYSKTYRDSDDLRGGIAAFRGFHQSLKPTSQGLALCLDYTVLAFRKKLPVIDFLKEHIRGFNNVNDIRRLKRDVSKALVGLKVTVNHRLTKQKYTIAGLTDESTRDLLFKLEDHESDEPPRRVFLVDYFKEKWGKDIQYLDIPCLDVGKGKRPNFVPMEFCMLLEGQRYPKEQLDKNAGIMLKNMSLAPPRVRMAAISEALQAEDGPSGGEIVRNFDIGVDNNMTSVVGRVIGAPALKLGGRMNQVRLDQDKCQWNLVNRMVVDARKIDRWALVDFTGGDRYNQLDIDTFIPSLMDRCRKLGMQMAKPLSVQFYDMQEFNNVKRLEQVLTGVIEDSKLDGRDRLQIIICVMAAKHDGYKYLKWVSETQLGVITQCCLSSNVNKRNNDQTLANIALKINAKLGGSNVELNEPLPLFRGSEHVMFVGADVNHPSPLNKTCPSISAVVATTNWPAANRYAARVCPQPHRKEKILSFGSMVLDLVNNYARINKVKPSRIVIFRDGVSDGQFDMVLNEELLDIKRALYSEDYQPTISLVVAQKRHRTRLFPESKSDGGSKGNVPPGTVVDTTIIHPFEYDFYLCSHFGGIGTSKPTHYYVLYDDHHFTSDQLQKLIYNMCFTFARCTKPVSLVPPVYYADLVAYRGRLFQEVGLELQSPASLFDDKFYKLHPELQNIMFFV